MRLWHKDLILYLPRQQLIAQWRECCAIAGSIVKKGTPNHLLVNKIMKYDLLHFISYTYYVKKELRNRGYQIFKKAENNFIYNVERIYGAIPFVIGAYPIFKIYLDWHNERYLKQCLFNLQEKYDCGGIPENEWKKIEDEFGKYLK